MSTAQVRKFDKGLTTVDSETNYWKTLTNGEETEANSSFTLRTGGRGRCHCVFEGRYPKQNSRPPVQFYHSPLSLSLLVYSPLF